MTFTTLKEYGVEKLFVLENGNTDSSQRNIVYLIHGEKVPHVQATAGMQSPVFLLNSDLEMFSFGTYKEMTWTSKHQSS